MPKLKNPKHEAFAKLVARGVSHAKAYVSAGYKAENENSAGASASRLLRQTPIALRIAELKPEADKYVNQIVDAETAKYVAEEIRTKAGRVQAIAERRQRLYDVIAARAADPDHADVPGHKTGLIAITMKALGTRYVKEASVDTALLRELRAMEQQVAQELGQWVERAESQVSLNRIEDASPAELETLMAALAQRAGEAAPGEDEGRESVQ